MFGSSLTKESQQKIEHKVRFLWNFYWIHCKLKKHVTHIDVTFTGTTSRFFTILQVLYTADVNFMLVHSIATLCTMSFGHIWIFYSIDM